MNLRGSLQVEVLDGAGKVVEVSKVVSGDGTRLNVPLAQLSSLAGKPVQFRFKVLDGSLFSFWVTRDREGASFGYVGAGGPGFAGQKMME